MKTRNFIFFDVELSGRLPRGPNQSCIPWVAPCSLHLRSLTSAQVSHRKIATFVTDFVLNNRHWPALPPGSAMIRRRAGTSSGAIYALTASLPTTFLALSLAVALALALALALVYIFTLLNFSCPLIPIWLATTSLTAAHLLHCERN